MVTITFPNEKLATGCGKCWKSIGSGFDVSDVSDRRPGSTGLGELSRGCYDLPLAGLMIS
jgi:hypothetical protein